MHLPEVLTGGQPPKLRATDERGWFRFQRLYDTARSCLPTGRVERDLGERRPTGPLTRP